MGAGKESLSAQVYGGKPLMENSDKRRLRNTEGLGPRREV